MSERGRKAILRRLKNIGLTEREAEETIQTLIDQMLNGLEKDGKILISGFGNFSVKQHRPRNARHPPPPPPPRNPPPRFKASPSLFTKYLKKH